MYLYYIRGGICLLFRRFFIFFPTYHRGDPDPEAPARRLDRGDDLRQQLHSNRQTEERRLVSLVNECIAAGQKILIPCFALGRAQEVLLILRAALQNGEIPAVPVFVDGMVRDINTMYTRNPTYLKNALAKRIMKGNEPFYTKEIQAVAPNQKRDELLASKDPVIIVSSSGMLTAVPVPSMPGNSSPLRMPVLS